jgi:hypothetical protein
MLVKSKSLFVLFWVTILWCAPSGQELKPEGLGFNWGGCFYFTKSDSIQYNSLSCKFRIKYFDTSGSNQVSATISVSGSEMVSGAIYSKNFVDTFVVNEDSSVNTYSQSANEKSLFPITDFVNTCRGESYKIVITGGGYSDSTLVKYKCEELGIYHPNNIRNQKNQKLYKINGAIIDRQSSQTPEIDVNISIMDK